MPVLFMPTIFMPTSKKKAEKIEAVLPCKMCQRMVANNRFSQFRHIYEYHTEVLVDRFRPLVSGGLTDSIRQAGESFGKALRGK